MDKVLAELSRVREENASQFKNMSTQLASASAKHDSNFAELREELHRCKAESAQRFQDLQLHFKTMEEKYILKETAMAARILEVEKKLESSQNALAKASEGGQSSRLISKIEDLEKEARKNNLIITGLAAERENVKKVAEKFFADKFDLHGIILEASVLTFAKDKYKIKVKLVGSESKHEILKKKRLLKGSDIFIDQDLTVNERQIAKNLRDLRRKRISEGCSVKMGYKKLIIDGATYHWSERDKNVKKPNRTATSDGNLSVSAVPTTVETHLASSSTQKN